MVRVRRLRHSEYMYVNPDLIERVEGRHQSVLHMVNGVEYVVIETPAQIIEQIVAARVEVIVTACGRLPGTPEAVATALVAHVVAPGTLESTDGTTDDRDATDDQDVTEHGEALREGSVEADAAPVDAQWLSSDESTCLVSDDTDDLSPPDEPSEASG